MIPQTTTMVSLKTKTKPKPKKSRMLFAATIPVAIMMAVALTPAITGVRAFAPSASFATRRTKSSVWATVEREEERKHSQEQKNKRKQKLSGIGIAPLGGNNKFGYDDPLKEFPSYEMKERYHKIHGHRAYNNVNRATQETKVHTFPITETKKKVSIKTTEEVKHSPSTPTAPCPPLLWASGEYFATDDLLQILRDNADVGNPLASSRTLADKIPTATHKDMDMDTDTSTASASTSASTITRALSCGSASCTMGGWPSKSPQPSTEVFYLLEGFGCLTDIDGTRHYFGPGDTVIVPKNWCGRWDVAEDLHKVSE
jgi:uncharacterized cupin superfamily protein